MTRVSVCDPRRSQITGTGNHGTWLWFRHKERVSREKAQGLSLSPGKKRWQKESAGDWADRLIGRGIGLAHHPEGDRRHRFLFLVRVDDGRFGTLDREVWAESRTDVLL